jgi:hypothetical protein
MQVARTYDQTGRPKVYISWFSARLSKRMTAEEAMSCFLYIIQDNDPHISFIRNKTP